jgi:hypothetical protein
VREASYGHTSATLHAHPRFFRQVQLSLMPALDPSSVISSDLSFGYLSAELKSPVKIPIPFNI